MRKNISLPPEYDKKLKELKQTTGVSTSEHIRRALDAYWERVKK